ncbi:hypothetical protein FDP41_011215 [Naegleria fowleri]|uniref:Uncharacterized protein n=1 Tax=Naegleria fowleri TaxID=5763 RepID=A0A6A5CA85_NAEFO|nr:uncharacterized protein FDP41_011215 [Naegleria fowleri]KAF0982285.1 hypothetical protein FDP41_011215 [Naegleria fowleri]CAG4716067.1 unnamed protein product [Naegleria fowleri]
MSFSHASLDSSSMTTKNFVQQPFLNLFVHSQPQSHPNDHYQPQTTTPCSSAHVDLASEKVHPVNHHHSLVDKSRSTLFNSHRVQQEQQQQQQVFNNPNFDHVDIATYYSSRNDDENQHHSVVLPEDSDYGEGAAAASSCHHVNVVAASIKVPTRISRRKLVIGFFVFIILHTLVMLLALGLFLGLYVGGETSQSTGNTNVVVGNSTLHQVAISMFPLMIGRMG